MPPNPASPQERQAAVDASLALLAVHSAQALGLVAGAPEVNIERCVQLLQLGERAGVSPSAAAMEDALRVLGGALVSAIQEVR